MGAIREQQHGDQQVVIFTIAGRISPAERDYWNQAIANLKAKFPQLAGVTLEGKPPPANLPPPGPLPAP
jgi:hypothetical protein